MPSSHRGLLRTALMVIPPSSVALGLYYQAKNTAHEQMLQMFQQTLSIPPIPHLETLYVRFMLRPDMILSLTEKLREQLTTDYLFDPNSLSVDRPTIADDRLVLRGYIDTLHNASLFFDPPFLQDKNRFLSHWLETFSTATKPKKTNPPKQEQEADILKIFMEMVTQALTARLHHDIKSYPNREKHQSLPQHLSIKFLVQSLKDLNYINKSRQTAEDIIKNQGTLVKTLENILSPKRS